MAKPLQWTCSSVFVVDNRCFMNCLTKLRHVSYLFLEYMIVFMRINLAVLDWVSLPHIRITHQCTSMSYIITQNEDVG